MKKLTVSVTRAEMILGFIYIAVQLLILPSVLVMGNRLLGSPFSTVQVQFALFCADFICVTVIFHRFLIQSAKCTLAAPFRTLRFAGIGLLLYWAGSFAVNLFVLNVYPNFSNVNDASIGQLTRDNYTLMVVGTVLLVPVTEETLYRGLVFGTLYKRSPVAAYAVSTLVFAALHIVSYIGSYEPLLLLLCFLQYVPAGLCLAWAYAQADSIWASILIHIAVNQMGVVAMR